MSEKKPNIIKLYNKALHEMPIVEFNKKVAFKTVKYSYADLKAVKAAVMPVFKEHGFAPHYSTLFIEEQLMLSCKIVHDSGGTVNDIHIPLRINVTPQDFGSELTYARRYALGLASGVVADEDDDGQIAQKADVMKKPKGSHKLDMNMRPALSAIFASTSLEEFEQVKIDFKDPILEIYKLWPLYMSETGGEKTKSFTDQIDDHKKRLQSQADIEKQQREDTEFKEDFAP